MDSFEWRCIICLDSGIPPIVSLTCSHSFCERCIETHRGETPILGQICPLCKTPHTSELYIKNDFLTSQAIASQKDEDDGMIDVSVSSQDIITMSAKRKTFTRKIELLERIVDRKRSASEKIENDIVSAQDRCLASTIETELWYQESLKKLEETKRRRINDSVKNMDITIDKLSLKRKQLDTDIEGLTTTVATSKSLVTQSDTVFEKNYSIYEAHIDRVYVKERYPLSDLGDSRSSIDYIDDCIVIRSYRLHNSKVIVYQFPERSLEKYKTSTITPPGIIKDVFYSNGEIFLITSPYTTDPSILTDYTVSVYDLKLKLLRQGMLKGYSIHYRFGYVRGDTLLGASGKKCKFIDFMTGSERYIKVKVPQGHNISQVSYKNGKVYVCVSLKLPGDIKKYQTSVINVTDDKLIYTGTDIAKIMVDSIHRVYIVIDSRGSKETPKEILQYDSTDSSLIKRKSYPHGLYYRFQFYLDHYDQLSKLSGCSIDYDEFKKKLTNINL